jgi:DNA-binding transcriptional ArsR family regulator
MKKAETLSKIARAFELLGNPLRFRIFLKVLEEGCDCSFEEQNGITSNCVSSLMRELSMPQSTVSTYLKDLADGELIECVKQGKFLYCRPNREILVKIKGFIDSSLSRISFSKD